MSASNSRPSALTEREVQVVNLAVQGYTTKEVADSLFVSPDTVKSHLREIFRKCGVRNRVELAGWWLGRPREVTQDAGIRPEGASVGLPACPPVEGLKRTTKGTALALVGLAATVVALFIFSAGGTPGSDTQTVVVATTCEAVSAEAAEDIASGCQRAPVTAITIH